jgi:GH18 family chitinase
MTKGVAMLYEFKTRFLFAVIFSLVVVRCSVVAADNAHQAQTHSERDETRVVGWYWWSMKDKFPISAIRFEDLTHIVYNPEDELLVAPDGHLKDTGAIDAHLQELRTIAHSQEIKVLMMMSEPGADFNLMMANPDARGTFIAEVVAYLRKHRLDGVEYDWEGNSHKDPYDWNGAEGDVDRQNYTTVIQETRAALKPHSLMLSICGAAWPPCFVTPAAFEHLDFINIMSYHDFEHALKGLQVWTDMGAPKPLLNMGMAVGFNEHGRDRRQAAREARYVVEHGYGGLLLFQLNYDTKDDTSMLKAVGGALREHGEK